MNISVKRELGHGSFGAVHLAESNGKECIMKMEKEDPNQDRGNRAYDRQVYFAEWLEKQPMSIRSRFMVLQSHGWINNCKTKLPVPKDLPPEFKKMAQAKNKLSTCYYLIYTPVLEQSLGEVLHGKEFREYSAVIRSVMKQIMPAMAHLEANGFRHGDLHKGNIMRKGKRWYIIDYGLVSHISLPFNTYDKCCRTPDVLSLAELSMYRPIRRMAWEEGKFKPKPFKKVIEAIKKSDAYPAIKKMTKKRNPLPFHIETLCELYYFDIFRDAFGAPKNMEIEPTKLCIKTAMFNTLVGISGKPN